MPRRNYLPYSVAEREEILKRQLCHELARAMLRSQQTQKYLARTFGTSPAVLSAVMNYDTKKVSFNQLFRFLIYLEPYLRILVAP